MVEIEFDSQGFPNAKVYSGEYDYLFIPMILMVLGVILAVIGFLLKRYSSRK